MQLRKYKRGEPCIDFDCGVIGADCMLFGDIKLSFFHDNQLPIATKVSVGCYLR